MKPWQRRSSRVGPVSFRVIEMDGSLAIRSTSMDIMNDEALRAELARQSRLAASVADRLMEIGRRYAALPDEKRRTSDEIIGYDETGVPR